MATIKQYLKDIINPNTDASAKRFVTLFLVFHFVVTAFLVTFFVFYLILFTPKGSVNPLLVSLLSDILETDKWVMLGGLGFITAEGLTQIIVRKYTKVSSLYGDADASNAPIINKEGENLGTDI